MSKMKHLLRKLHIGGGLNEHHRLGETRPETNPSPNPSSSTSSSDPGTMGRMGVVESVVGDRTEGEGGVDYNLLEEEYQVQLALAISASDPDVREEAESAQIDTAKRMSLGCRSASVTETDAFVEFLSLRYWSYNAVNYDEKIVDGFYDVYGITSNSVAQGKMPLLVDLQAVSLSDNFDYEVILVNRLVDRKLQELEKRAYNVSVECRLCELSPVLSGLIQKIADIVVERMGGPVGDADDMCRQWISRHSELRNLLKTNILPLGCLDVGLSRHRALLFKVLADRISLPCMLVKGSCYTGTDDGAVNLIRIDDGCEYIIDLMGAPGTLIPAEVPSNHLQNAGLDARGFPDHTKTSRVSQFALDRQLEIPALSPILESIPEVSSSMSEDAIFVGVDTTRVNLHGVGARALHEKQTHGSPLSPASEFCQRHLEKTLVGDNSVMERIFDCTNFYTESTVESVEMNNDDMPTCNGRGDKINPLLMEVAEWEIPWEDLQIGERIGIGSYGEVYHADWNGTEVAVKKFLNQDFSGDALMQFKCEVDIMLRLRHPNVVLFMGAVTHPPHFSILTEFLPRGSLYRLLHRPNPLLDEKRRMRMALDVAKGMNYLHTSHPTIVHRDLKSSNLLVDKNWVVKVCDFGLSRMKHHTFLSSKSTAGTPEWMAPEVLRNEQANEKCDVYSFGVILWELATLWIPWKGLNPMQVVGAVGFQNRRLEIPEDVDPVVAQIIRDCWQTLVTPQGIENLCRLEIKVNVEFLISPVLQALLESL
ncbi:serine/threonine-protein kinase EDR1-like isoform X3 [Mangifera indica]|uniref:serine/threonine-protein kinase EDR1-like isoform X3 n=1 Tax=Mangifera indica TaxID=29780 RepID=UPI001CFA6CA1|nr:serine/threonine-protein kinase EDR1-like isoform X3 [Mangifera indica]